jgi:hypothetical protein
MICERVQSSELKAANTLASWTYEDHTFFIRQRTSDDPPAEGEEGDSNIDQVAEAGGSAAVWLFGDCFFKAHAWIEGLQLEAENIRFVKERVPEIPVPEVIYSWIDRALDRTFLITKRMSGTPLHLTWEQLSLSQMRKLAEEVTDAILKLAAITSPRFETISGKAVQESWLRQDAPESHPSWKPYPLGPFSLEEMREYLARISSMPAPFIDEDFLFYHADLGPSNIMVAEDGTLSGIIDWEQAAYFPKFWLATKTATGAFSLGRGLDDPWLWGTCLARALHFRGYKRNLKEYYDWQENIVQGV